MMLFKLSLKNIKKSFKDYAIYFLTLILGVAIFYMFNSIDSQETRLAMSSSTREIVKLLINMLSGLSVFISVILGFLIIYANNFLIKRRKKEFGTYMLLGMSKSQVSKILVFETILIGTISLGIGLVIGVFASQFMSILVAKMFEVDMTKFEFIFSKSACIKTLGYFGIMYIAVLVFNTISVSKYKLIDLLTAIKKNEKVKIKNTFLCAIIFVISIVLLAWSYHRVTADYQTLLSANTFTPLLIPIIGGCLGTFLFFWSLSGFLLQVIQSNKTIYLRNTNMFVLRQLNSKINTTVFSMTIICLMLFVTICVLSSAMSLNDSFKSSIKELTPVDIQVSKPVISEYTEEVTEEQIENSKLTIEEELTRAGLDTNNKFKDIFRYNKYHMEDVTIGKTLGTTLDDVKKQFPYMRVDTEEDILKLSDYNKIAEIYNNEQFTLKENEYLIIADYDSILAVRNNALKVGTLLKINGKEYTPKYKECKDAFVDIAGNHINGGIIILPDSALDDKYITSQELIANYNANTEEQKQEIENEVTSMNEATFEKYGGTSLTANTKLNIYESSTGLTAMIIFLALYLGIIFLIASSAILALKELTDSSDNKQRYSILRKIGTDEKMINKSLFMQIAIFFLMPLILAIIHSIFGITFALKILETINPIDELVGPVIITAIFIALIYGGYFIITYFSSKNIIREE